MSPRAFENNSLCKIWGANKVYYAEFENRELQTSTYRFINGERFEFGKNKTRNLRMNIITVRGLKGS